MESFAMMMAPRMAVATSLLHFTPSPTWPLQSPMATKALNLVRCPALVCFWTGMIFRTSSLRASPRKRSMISCSLMGREEVNLLQGLDLAILHQTAKLSHWDPFLLLLAPATSPATVSTPPAPIATAP